MKVWIDLANSPHPLLFRPIARRLEAEGATVVVTVRDHAQTRQLALERWPQAAVIGAASPDGRLAKSRGIAERIRGLTRWARTERPDVALSHNSYAQILAARSLGIRVVTAMDYEHQPANHLAFRAAHRILLPEALPAAATRRQGASERKVVRYDGLKEEIYLADFEPDPGIAGSLGLDLGDRGLAVVRAAPAGATYHAGENPLFEQVLRRLDQSGAFLTVALARHPGQQQAIAALGLASVIAPAAAIDARSLLCAADLFVGAGGTMTREAALLGTPAFSIFAGRSAAVDRLLEQQGSLTHLHDPGELPLTRVAAGDRLARLVQLRRSGESIIESFVATTLGAPQRAADGR